MADFKSWSQESLVKFAEAQQAENKLLRTAIKNLLMEFERLGDVYIFDPQRNHRYNMAKEVVNDPRS